MDKIKSLIRKKVLYWLGELAKDHLMCLLKKMFYGCKKSFKCQINTIMINIITKQKVGSPPKLFTESLI